MVQATYSPFSVSPSSLRRKMVPRNPALNCWCSVSHHIKIKIETVQAIPIKCFVSHRPTDPFFWKSEKKFRITCKEASTLVYKHTMLSY